MILIFGAETPFAQVIPIFFLNLTLFGLLFFLRPLKTRMDNNITLFNITVSTAMYLGMLLVYIADFVISEKNKNLFLGNFMILIVVASVLFNLLIGIWTTIDAIR